VTPLISRRVRGLTALLVPIVLGGFLLAPASAQAADEPAKPVALPSDLALVPTDAVAFFHFRAADLWKSDALADLRLLVDKAGPDVLKQFRQRYAPDPATIDRITLVLPSSKQFIEGPFPSVDPEAVSALVIVSTTKPYDRLRLMEALGSREKVYRRSLYYFNEELWSGLLLVDDHTFVIASEDALIQFLDQAREPKKDGGLTAALQTAAAGNQFVYGVNPKVLAKEPQFQMVPGNLKPLLEAECITVAANFDKEMRFDFRLDYAKEADAQEGEKAARAALEMLRQYLGMGIAEVEKHLKEAEDKPGAGSVAESASMILALGFLRTLDDELKQAPLARKGATVLLPLRYRKHDSAALLVAGLGFTTWMEARSTRVFRNVARAIAVGGVAKEENPREQKLKKIAAALEKYHELKGAYPPAAMHDSDGRPTLSWRVALLPYLGEEELFKEFRPEEPWDSLHNKRLLKRLPEVFKTDDFDGNMRFMGEYGDGDRWRTHVRVITGAGTVFDGPTGVKKTDVAGTTILLALAEDRGPYWTKPADIRYAADQPASAIFPKAGEAVHVLLADGTFKALDRATEAKALRSMIVRKKSGE
jgi:hypothetical protein